MRMDQEKLRRVKQITLSDGADDVQVPALSFDTYDVILYGMKHYDTVQTMALKRYYFKPLSFLSPLYVSKLDPPRNDKNRIVLVRGSSWLTIRNIFHSFDYHTYLPRLLSTEDSCPHIPDEEITAAFYKAQDTGFVKDDEMTDFIHKVSKLIASEGDIGVDTDLSTADKIDQILEVGGKLLKHKNRKYGDSIFSPIHIFSKDSNGLASRLDEKIARIQQTDYPQENDVWDLWGYITLYLAHKGWNDTDKIMN